MNKIIKEILKFFPEDKIADACFEGANIVLYSKDKGLFLDDQGAIRKAVNAVKKRIELRADPSLCMPVEDARSKIEELIPEDAGIDNIIFDPERSRVIIEVEKPGLAIGKQGSNLHNIKEATAWSPHVKRMPAIRSQIIENIRSVLYEHSDYRRKFLNRVGRRIYDGWVREKKEEWIRVTFLGAGRQVGRSAIYLQTPESRILFDCGVDPAKDFGDSESYPYLEAPEFNVQELDAVVVSHAHVDHCGLIPYLFKFGYEGPVYCTHPTRDVMALMMLDYVKIQHYEGLDPIYTSDEVKEVVKHSICLDYEEVTDITPDVRLTFYNSGHILGGAMCHIHIGNGLYNLLYTGDIKYGYTRLLEKAATKFPRMEAMILESTYGGRKNIGGDPRKQDKVLRDAVKRTVERGGKVLMPTLGSGRAQELMVMIEDMVHKGEIDEIPVYIDGMVWDIAAIHTAYPEFLKRNVRKLIFHKDRNPFLSKIFKRVGSHKERKQLVEEHGPCIILATSGMLVGGPSVGYLKELAEDKRHTLIFSCYQAQGTLGRRIQRGEKEIAFQKGNRQEILKIKMEVLKLVVSGHSDRKELMRFVKHCNPRPRKIMINHGESGRCLDLASSLHKRYHLETLAPKNLDALRLK